MMTFGLPYEVRAITTYVVFACSQVIPSLVGSTAMPSVNSAWLLRESLQCNTAHSAPSCKKHFECLTVLLPPLLRIHLTPLSLLWLLSGPCFRLMVRYVLLVDVETIQSDTGHDGALSLCSWRGSLLNQVSTGQLSMI